jgi:hypothetical protein
MNLLFEVIKAKNINNEEFFLTAVKLKEFEKFFIPEKKSSEVPPGENIQIPEFISVLFNGSYEFLLSPAGQRTGKLIISGDTNFFINESDILINYISKFANNDSLNSDFDIALILTFQKEIPDLEKSYDIFSSTTDYLLENFSELSELVEPFEKLSTGSGKLFTKKTIEESEDELLKMSFLDSLDKEQKIQYLMDFWKTIISIFKFDKESRELKPYQIREDYIILVNFTIRALASVAVYLIKEYKNNWISKFLEVVPGDYNYWKKENPIWVSKGVVNKENDKLEINNREETVELIKSVILSKFTKGAVSSSDKPLGEYLADEIEKAYRKISPYLVFNSRLDGNRSIKSKKVFVYLDFYKNKRKLVARLRVNPNNLKLKKYSNFWGEYTGKHAIGNWAPDIIEINITDENLIPIYLEIFEIARSEND